MAKVAVILSGCGYLDGSEVQEAVLTLYFLDRAGVEVSCFAPDRDQMHVVDHRSGEATTERRNALVESARITRGEIKSLAMASMKDLDALVIPGGYGAAKNLSNLATRGVDARVDSDLQRLITEATEQGKPIVAICIAPAVLTAALAKRGERATVTVGNDLEISKAIESFGSTHRDCPVTQIVVDDRRRIISTPAYMLGSGPKGVGAGIEAAVSALMAWIS